MTSSRRPIDRRVLAAEDKRASSTCWCGTPTHSPIAAADASRLMSDRRRYPRFRPPQRAFLNFRRAHRARLTMILARSRKRRHRHEASQL
jgi:hypothetical protein